MYDSYAYTHGIPCRNPSCKSYGHAHPNCDCASGTHGALAHGGKVESFCSTYNPHSKECEYYAEGGHVQGMPSAPVQEEVSDNPEGIIGYAAVHHGLLGLLKDVGQTGKSLSHPEKHILLLQDIKKSGHKLGDLLRNKDHDGAASIMDGHPLMGGAGKKSLSPIMERMSYPLLLKEPHPAGFRGAADYLHSAIKGNDRFHEHFNDLIGSKSKHSLGPDDASRRDLSSALDEIKIHPEDLLEIGGTLGHYLPQHSVHLAAHIAAATQYLDSIKPKTQQLAPLDSPESVDKQAQATYDRQLDIAQDPLLVLQHVKDGTLLPQDLTTVATLYPGLHKKMITQTTEAIIEAKTKDIPIPYKQKQTLSLLLGDALDFTQTPAAILAIMGSGGVAPAQPSKRSGSARQKSPSQATQRTIEKTDRLYETPLEARQIGDRT